MSGARQTWLRHRLAMVLIPVATVAVHQLRYLLTYGSGAGHELAMSGDGYIAALLPGVALLGLAAVLLAAASLWRAAHGRSPSTRPAPSLRALWALAVGVLLAGYLVQESLEVVLGSAHVSILTQAFGHGGWWVLPAAGLVAFGWAAAVHGSRAVLAYARRKARHRRRDAAVPSDAAIRRGREVVPPPAHPLARRLAGRAPPCAPS